MSLPISYLFNIYKKEKVMTGKFLRVLLSMKGHKLEIEGLSVDVNGFTPVQFATDSMSAENFTGEECPSLFFAQASLAAAGMTYSAKQLKFTGVSLPRVADWIGLTGLPESEEDLFLSTKPAENAEWQDILFARYRNAMPADTIEADDLRIATESSGVCKIEALAAELKPAYLPGLTAVFKGGQWQPPLSSAFPPVSFSGRVETTPSGDSRWQVKSFSVITSLGNAALTGVYAFPGLDFNVWRRNPSMLASGSIESLHLRLKDNGFVGLLARHQDIPYVMPSIKYLVSVINDSKTSDETVKILYSIANFLRYPGYIEVSIEPKVKIPLQIFPVYLIESPKIVNMHTYIDKGTDQAFSF